MRGHAKFALTVVVVGALLIGGYRLALPWIDAKLQKTTTDAVHTQGTVRIAVDGWVGYFPLCSPQMITRMRRSGYLLECNDDKADYRQRFERLQADHYDFAVATVDSYLLNGRAFDYPGPIVAVVDESKGGDALIAWREQLPNLDAVKTREQLTIAYTPASPSHHLLKAVASHFDAPVLREKSVAVFTEGSAEAYRQFIEKKVDAAVLWEPEVSKALAHEGTITLLSTADTKGLIVDVLIAGRTLVLKSPQLVELTLEQYFKTLQHYRNQPDELARDIAAHYRIDKDQAQTLLQGVEWASLSDNARTWFGLEHSTGLRQGLVDAIESTVDILLDHGDFNDNPLPQKDPYRVLNSKPLQQVWNNATFTQTSANDAGAITFEPLSDAQWGQLQPVATLKVRPIIFASGSAELTESGKDQLQKLIKDLNHYPQFRVEIRGHTGLRGDPQANRALSSERAQEVLRHLRQQHGLTDHRARAIGFGSERPLPQAAGESDRAYNYRLPRVELVLLEEEI